MYLCVLLIIHNDNIIIFGGTENHVASLLRIQLVSDTRTHGHTDTQTEVHMEVVPT